MLRKAVFIALICVFAGCAQKQAPEMTTPVAEEEKAPVMNSLESFVAGSVIGSKASLENTNYGDVDVVLRNEYFAASGKRCRLVDVRTKESCTIELVVCQEEDKNWKEAPVLWNGCSQ